MCLAQKMPDVKVPVTSAPAAAAAPPPDLQTEFTDKDTVTANLKKKSRGKKSLRIQRKDNAGLQVNSTPQP